MPTARRLAWPAAFAGTALVLAGLSVGLFIRYLERPDLDQGIHVVYAQRLVADGALLPHFLYHLLVAIGSGFSRDLQRLTLAAAVVLALLVLAKLAVSLGLVRELLARAGAPLAPAVALGLALAFCFVAPLPKWWAPENIYLGQLSPTVWHNPTAITVLPLAVATFWAFLRHRDHDRRDALLVGVLLAVSVTAKPNFALAFGPAAVLLQLARRRLAIVDGMLMYAPAVAVLAWQYVHALGSGLEAPGAGMVTLDPLAVWELYSPHPLVSALVSLAFPLAVAASCGRGAKLPRALVAAWLLAAVAIAQFALLAEPEPRMGDANYYWGVVPAVYLLFVVSVAELLAPRTLSRGRRVAVALCWTLLALHTASGLFLYAWPFQLAVAD